MARILLIDDDKECLTQAATLLKCLGHEVFPLMNAGKLFEALKEANPDIVVTDIMMPGVTGGAVYDYVREMRGPDVPVIISSGTRLKLKHTDPLLAYCPKPIDVQSLVETIDALLAQKAASVDKPEPLE